MLKLNFVMFDHDYMCGCGTQVIENKITYQKEQPNKDEAFQSVFMAHSCHVVVQTLILNSVLKPTNCSRV